MQPRKWSKLSSARRLILVVIALTLLGCGGGGGGGSGGGGGTATSSDPPSISNLQYFPASAVLNSWWRNGTRSQEVSISLMRAAT